MTTNLQLDKYLKSKKTIAPFEGVFPSNKLPNVPKNHNFCLVANYDPSNKQGSHWVALAVIDGKALWFDSYGMKPDASDLILNDKTNFTQYLKKYSNTIDYNKIDYQQMESDVCGLYACYFCLYGLPENNIKAWNWASDNKKQNDAQIERLVPVPLILS